MLKRDNTWVLTAIILLTDVISINISYLLAFLIRFYTIIPAQKGIPTIYSYLAPMVLITPLFLIIFKLNSLYDIQKIKNESFQVIKAISLLLITFMALTFLYREISYSRVFLAFFWITSIILVSISRQIISSIKKFLTKKGILIKKALIIGNIKPDLINKIESTKEYKIIKVVPVNIKKIKRLIMLYNIDTIFISLPEKEQSKILEIVNQLGHHIDYKIIPTTTDIIKKQFTISYVNTLPILTLKETPLQGFNKLIKRIFDLIIVLIFIIVFSPLFLLIALIIKATSKGSVFYRQERVSYNNKPFTIYKFRTMIQDAEAQTGPIWAANKDSRVTKVGLFLRKTNLDELPQLVNVIKGDMSLVGPRPERPFFTKKFEKQIRQYLERHAIKPGLTGWAQINGYTGNTSLEGRIRHDIYYIENWSILLDIKILLLTMPSILLQGLGFYKGKHHP